MTSRFVAGFFGEESIMSTAWGIRPHLWFDTEAREAAAFYCSVFPASKQTGFTVLHDVPTPTGDCEVVTFELGGQGFMAISAGPHFRFNPAISFIVNYDPSVDVAAREHLDEAWSVLSEGGQVLMPIGAYPFSQRYGWVQDRFGLSWQLILTDPEGERRPFITPLLMFAGDVCGKAEEAVDFYLSVFGGGRRGTLIRYPAGMEPDREGTVMFSDFQVEGTWLAAMDSARADGFEFNEAISFMVCCADQARIDHCWDRLSAVPDAEACGWLKDRYGVSWQIVPPAMDEMLQCGDAARVARVMQALLKMKKPDIAALTRAFDGRG